MLIRRLPAILLLCAFMLASVCCNEAEAQRGRNRQPRGRAKNAPSQPATSSRSLPLEQIKLPPGFRIDLYVADVPSARSLALSPDGTLFIGSRDAGVVYAARDEDGDGSAESVRTVASGLHLPVGVAFHEGDLYYSEVAAVWRIDDIERNLDNPGRARKLADFPTEEHHGWKFIAVGPDDKLYVPVGVPCNVCDEGDPFGAILRLDLDGGNQTVVARGMRNTVGFDWHPQTGELWWTDNGRDMLGDDIPPDELNRIPRGSGSGAGAPHYGFPYWHGQDIPDPEFKGGPDRWVRPVQDLGPHVAALGMEFYEGGMFPAEYRNQIFIAEHGSWNRTAKIGYRVMLVKLDAKGKSLGYSVFAEGWKQGEQVWGRPVDVELMPDGSLLVSDDYAGCVYRISYAGS
jgi:glucose/arabinose dehydrogenase